MRVLTKISEIKSFLSEKKRLQTKTIGFVPTMGYLHDGHLSLVKDSQRMTDCTIVSIFVNPLQFGKNEDFSKYPRDEKKDFDLLTKLDVDAVFMPAYEELYPENFCSYVTTEKLSDVLCGASRPGHFRGVCTVVLKLLNIVEPDYVFFGQKDAQQALIIKTMVKDLNVNVKVVTLPTVREQSGLAMSSRNSYLSEDSRKDAAIIYRALSEAQLMIEKGEHHAQTIKNFIISVIKQVERIKIDYVEIVDYELLKTVTTIKPNTLISVAVHLDGTRLIDNIIVG